MKAHRARDVVVSDEMKAELAELRQKLADAEAETERWRGLAEGREDYIGTIVKRLRTAEELADATTAMEDGLTGPDGHGDLSLVVTYKRAMDAYRAAKEERDGESRTK